MVTFKLGTLSRDQLLLRIFRIALAGFAIIALVASIFPHGSAGEGALLYLFLWPLLGVQLLLARLNWERPAQESPAIIFIAAGLVGFVAFFVDYLMFQLAGYIR